MTLQYQTALVAAAASRSTTIRGGTIVLPPKLPKNAPNLSSQQAEMNEHLETEATNQLISTDTDSILSNASNKIPIKRGGNVVTQMYEKWFEISEVVRFLVSGNCGTVCFYALDQLIYTTLCRYNNLPSFLENYKETLSFFLGYFFQIATQHSLNALLVYGLHTINTKDKYMKTLVGQYTGYTFALVGSTILNAILMQGFGINRRVAFIGTLSVFAVINYYLIGYLTRKAAKNDEMNSDRTEALVATTTAMRGGNFHSNSVLWTTASDILEEHKLL